jgi:hypothetical protein
MMISDKRINIFVGHFGSGKTEISINYALDLQRRGLKTMIVDLDIVNPFFRTVEVKDYLEQNEIKVIAPNFAGTALDVPSIPASVYSAFDNANFNVVLDIGGDDAGARILGNLRDHISDGTYDMLYVINARRPLSADISAVGNLLHSIEQTSGLKVTGLINNTNLSSETTIYDIMYGQVLAEDLSRQADIPIVKICGMPHVLEQLPDEYKDKAMPIKIFLHVPWEQ